MTSITLILVSFVYMAIDVKGICDSQTGPVGSLDCASNSNFNRKQWNTCLTNDYIQHQSLGRKKCLNDRDNYCNYPCMTELYYLQNGDVVDKCACDDSANPPVSSLPTECFSPNGSNCDWYKSCLERKYACQGTSTEYAFDYATLFCNLSVKHKPAFTDRALRWINDGRRCFEVALVPFVRPFINGTCGEIHEVASDAFKPCNIQPHPGQGSICDITRRDWLRAFWMMKSEYSIPTSTAAYVWLQDALDTFYECQNDPEVNDFGHIHQEFRLVVDLVQTSWTNPDSWNKHQFDRIALDVVQRMAEFLGTPSERWGWYGYGVPLSMQRFTARYEQMTIVLLVADLPGIMNDTLIPPVNVTNIEFNQVIEKLKHALTNGDLELRNDNGTVYVSQMSHCLDMKCHATIENIFAPTYVPASDGSDLRLSLIFLLCLPLTIFCVCD